MTVLDTGTWATSQAKHFDSESAIAFKEESRTKTHSQDCGQEPQKGELAVVAQVETKPHASRIKTLKTTIGTRVENLLRGTIHTYPEMSPEYCDNFVDEEMTAGEYNGSDNTGIQNINSGGTVHKLPNDKGTVECSCEDKDKAAHHPRTRPVDEVEIAIPTQRSTKCPQYKLQEILPPSRLMSIVSRLSLSEGGDDVK